MHTIATIAEGEAGWADLLFLVAFIVFVIAAFIHVAARSIEGALLPVGLALLALAWLLL